MSFKKFSKSRVFILISFLGSLVWIIWFIISLLNLSEINNIKYEIWNISLDNSNNNISWINNLNNFERNSWSINIDQSNKNILQKTEEEELIESLSRKWKSYVVDFYNYINNRSFDNLYSIFDNVIKKDETVMTYFSYQRINNFLNKIDWSIKIIWDIKEINNHNKNEEYSIRRWYEYLIQYEVDWQIYKERWEMILVSYDEWNRFFVNSIKCSTKSCSKMPFFN